jgi:hypothetical protein
MDRRAGSDRGGAFVNSFILRVCKECDEVGCKCKAGFDVVFVCSICSEWLTSKIAGDACCRDLMAKDSEVGTIPIVRTKTQRPFPESQYSNAENERTY